MKKLLIYIVLMTWVLTLMDWRPIHYAWWHWGQYPTYAQNNWMNIRFLTGMVLCPPCMPLAENYYYVMLDVEAGTKEQQDVLPVKYNHNPINPHGDWAFYWGQGQGQPWRKVSMLSLYLWWVPYSVIWYLVTKKIFSKVSNGTKN